MSRSRFSSRGATLLTTAITMLAAGLGVARGASLPPETESSPVPSQSSGPATSVVEAVARATQVASYSGWAAWSRYDSTKGEYALVVRNPEGAISTMGVAERAKPFDVSLGPLPSGRVGAVYSRCTNAAKLKGCKLVELAVGSATASEKRLAVPGVGSVYSPALWKNRIAFLRVVPGGGERHPVEMFEWTVGSKKLQAFVLPRNSYPASELKQFAELRKTNGYVGQIAALSLNGTQVSYTRVAPIEPAVEVSDLWVQRPGQRPTLIDRVDTGGAATGLRSYLSPTIVGSWLYAYRQYADQGTSWVRYGLGSKVAQQANVNFGDGNEDQVQAATPLGAGVIWSLLNARSGGIPGIGAQLLRLPSVSWKALKRPHPGSSIGL